MSKLFLGDVLESLAKIEDESVDLIVTDPPYLNITGGSGVGKNDGRPSGILAANDGKVFRHNKITPDDYLPELFRVLRPQAHLYIMTNFLGIKEGIIDRLHKHGFDTHNLLTWRKNNATPNRWYMKDLEYTLFARKGPAFAVNDSGVRSSLTVFDHPLDHDNPKSPKRHPTEKPISLMETYIKQSSKPGDTVLDPFMGAGSTGVASVNLDRNFIGIEIDPDFFAVAERRIQGSQVVEVNQPVNLFFKALKLNEAENFG